MVVGSGRAIFKPFAVVKEILFPLFLSITKRSSLKVKVIAAGDLVSIALFLGLAEIKAVCALALGMVEINSAIMTAPIRFILRRIPSTVI